ncbi:carboxypeptidase-like regulatory domain-containing protein [Anatilimnocola floriformis]|uniref:carboxypeptidase-like regulatory domain-containing protein n=1 Tax=Anatilimnocola floriformis TaxID=2948575 RepID=UPI0020C3DD4C|nr:carboxypeptidase-like regulatory domain-containing protein [Anatilimnocola floriformis]
MKLGQLLAVCFVLALLTGCGELPATVSGKIMLDGAPLPNAHISFRPTSASGGTVAYGKSDASGNYRLNSGTAIGLTVGTYQVAISATEVPAVGEGGADPVPKLLTPAKYGEHTKSGFAAEVKAGSNKFDFELSSKP